ncbi:MAG: pantetheine-phosphate adenylyltransferase [bacterium]
MNVAIKKTYLNLMPVFPRNKLAQSQSQSNINQNKINDSRYDFSIYKNKGITLPFGVKATAVYAGSFDPITKGHLDILKIAAKLFDQVIVLIAKNPRKTRYIPIDDAVDLIKKSVEDLNNVKVDTYKGLTANYAKEKGAGFLLRGLRTVSDFDSEMQLSEINRRLNPELKTIFLPASSENNAISSSAVREILNNDGDISQFVPQSVAEYLYKHQKGQ